MVVVVVVSGSSSSSSGIGRGMIAAAVAATVCGSGPASPTRQQRPRQRRGQCGECAVATDEEKVSHVNARRGELRATARRQSARQARGRAVAHTCWSMSFVARLGADADAPSAPRDLLGADEGRAPRAGDPDVPARDAENGRVAGAAAAGPERRGASRWLGPELLSVGVSVIDSWSA